MKKILFLGLLYFVSFGATQAQDRRTLTLEDVIELAKQNSRSAKTAETRRTLGFWEFRVYQSQLKPQLLLRGTFPNYVNRSIPVTQPDGNIEFKAVNQNNFDLALGLQQVLPLTNTTGSS